MPIDLYVNINGRKFVEKWERLNETNIFDSDRYETGGDSSFSTNAKNLAKHIKYRFNTERESCGCGKAGCFRSVYT
jgi:hypothetical protein